MIEKETLYDLYIIRKMNQIEIGALYNCDRKNVDYYLKKYEIPKRSRSEAKWLESEKKTGFTLDKLQADIKAGLLLGEIAQKYNMSRSALNNFLKLHDLNFKNHETQRTLQRERMKKENPVPKGSSRAPEIMQPAREATKEKGINRRASITEFTEYAKAARGVAYTLYKKKTPEGLEIDHIFSVKDGFIYRVPVDFISHPANLRLITQAENKRKSHKSIISFEDFCRLTGYEQT